MKITTLLYSLLIFSLQAVVVEVRSIEDIVTHIDENTWVLVDLENCLFEIEWPLQHAKWFYDEVEKKIKTGMSKEKAIEAVYPAWVKTEMNGKVKPIEPTFIPLLLKLQERQIVVMGFTHRQPSTRGGTKKHIAFLGFDFSKTAIVEREMVLQYNPPAMSSGGIIFAHGSNREIDILRLFLAKTKKNPKKIVFISNNRGDLEDLESIVEDGIDYVGVHLI